METLRSPNEASLRSHLAAWGQEHVLRFWPELTPAQQTRLADQLATVDLDLLQRLFARRQAADDSDLPPDPLRPDHVHRLPDSMDDWEREEKAAAAGETLLAAGQVGVILVAGGQGTRLGFDGPKGTFPIAPLSGKSLFQIHAEKVLALGRRHERPIPFLVMTSPDNDAATREFFTRHRYFGLDPAQVWFFTQGMMPAVDRTTGKLLLAAKDALALSPNGHGGVLQALADGGRLDALAAMGVTHLHYFQVDNPLVKVADPAYLGAHFQAGAEMSVKVVAKRRPDEKLGVVVERGDRLALIEYSDLPDALARQRGPDGQLVYWAGSIAIHVFNVSFLQRLCQGGHALPYHLAVKSVPHVNELGDLVKPAEPNAIKFETFVFDALPMARQALVVETSRAEEFEPLKNAEGEHTAATVRQAMANLFGGWLESAGVRVPRDPDGNVPFPIEISPLFALDAEELRARLPDLEEVREPLLLDGR